MIVKKWVSSAVFVLFALKAVVAMAVTVINVNTAPAAQLAELLQGVGMVKAEAIVRYRDQNGPFASLDELTQVSGIGEATVASNRDRITFEERDQSD
jgi:competence protein ComEA